MATRIRIGKEGEFILPRDLLEGEPPEVGSVLRVCADEEGNLVLMPITPVREYTSGDLKTFAQENEMGPDLESRLRAVLEREPRFYGR